MASNTSLQSVIAKASTEGYAITLEQSAIRLAYDPEAFMPAAAEELALAPGHALIQVAQAVEVVKHALSFPTIDDYLERSLSLMGQQSTSYGSGLYSSYEPKLRHQYMFIRHLGLATSIEHDDIDFIFDELERAMVRGDDALRLTESVLDDGSRIRQLNKYTDMFITSVNHWLFRKDEAKTTRIFRSDGSVRSLRLMSVLFWVLLNVRLESEILKKNCNLVRAVHKLDHGPRHCFGSNIDGILATLSTTYAKMEISEVHALKSDAGVQLSPDRFEVEIRLRRYIESLDLGEADHDQLVSYVLSGNYSLEGILHDILQFKGMDYLTFENAQQRRASVIQFAKALHTVMLRDTSNKLLLEQRGFASVFEKGSPEYYVMLEIEGSKMLAEVAQRFTPDQCIDSPALLAVCGSRPVSEFEVWGDGFDELGLVAEALYRMTGDTAYMLMVKNLTTRGRMFAGDLGV